MVSWSEKVLRWNKFFLENLNHTNQNIPSNIYYEEKHEVWACLHFTFPQGKQGRVVAAKVCLAVRPIVLVFFGAEIGFLKKITLISFGFESKAWKRFCREKLRQDIGLRFSNFGSEMVENCRAEFFLFCFFPLIVNGSRSHSPASSYCA